MIRRPLIVVASAVCCALCGIAFLADRLGRSIPGYGPTGGGMPGPEVRIWNTFSVPYEVVFGTILLLAGAFLILPAISTWRRAKAERDRVLGLTRASQGLCPHCGYDLRASHDRCPECGNAIPPKQTVASASHSSRPRQAGEG